MARVALALALVVAAQAPGQFKSTADLVSIYATVRDEAGRLVPGLTRDDFTVSDNGKRQTLVHFTNDVHPFSAVVMLDRSASMTDHHELVRDAGRAFVRAMLPADAARVGSFSDTIRISPEDFTSDHDALAALLDDLLETGASPVWTALDRGITSLATRPGRRVLLVLTDGYNDPPLGLPITELEDVIRRARYNDILMYVIGFAATETVASTPILPRPVGSPPKPRRPGGFPGQPTPLPLPPGRPTMITTKVQPPYKGLRILADETGGGYYEMDATGDLSATFARIADELHRQYWMAFTPAKLDSRIHEIEVKVRRRGVEVRARKSYFADPGRESKEPNP
jgi:VWFA-related protein